MEYLMTYGWVLIVIAIVLAVLYYLGVFSGNSQASQACVAAPSYSCSFVSLGSMGTLNTNVAVFLGGVTVNSLGCSNTSSEPSTFSSITPISMNNGQVTSLSFSCPGIADMLGAPFRGTLWITYSTSSQSGLVAEVGAVSARVTYIGTTVSAGNSLGYVPITLTNSQSTGTGSSFQQMITVTSSSYSQYINSGWSNVEFTYNAPAGSGGTALQAWIESGASNTASSTVVWVNIPAGIAANANAVVYMNFVSGNVMSASGPTGEASQLSGTYGEYDNIAQVMASGLEYQVYYYSGSTCSSASYQDQLYAATLANSVTISGCASFVSSTAPFTTSGTGSTQNVDGTNENYVVLNLQEGDSGGSAYPDPPVADNAYSWQIKTIGWAEVPSSTTFYVETDDGTAVGDAPSGTSGTTSDWLGGSSNPNNIVSSWTTQSAAEYSGTVSTAGAYRIEDDYFEDGGEAYTALWSSQSISYYHANFPPNGVMPSASFGSYV